MIEVTSKDIDKTVKDIEQDTSFIKSSDPYWAKYLVARDKVKKLNENLDERSKAIGLHLQQMQRLSR